jgi:Spy/CpxP family protein refolding chaperone
MKVPWTILIVMVGVLATSAMAQDESLNPSANDSAIGIDPSDKSSPDSVAVLEPQDVLKKYEEQMARVSASTCEQLTLIAQALRQGQVSTEQAQYLTGRQYELGMMRLQFLDTLHQILEANLNKEDNSGKETEDSSGKEGGQQPAVQLLKEAVVVPPATSSPDISESVAKYLELTPVQVAAIQSQVEKERREVQPLVEQLSKNRKELTAATLTGRFDQKRVQQLAAEQSHMLEQLIVANSRLQTNVYRILTVEQQRKFDDLRKQTATSAQPPFAE